jgi:hypothetical protein
MLVKNELILTNRQKTSYDYISCLLLFSYNFQILEKQDSFFFWQLLSHLPRVRQQRKRWPTNIYLIVDRNFSKCSPPCLLSSLPDGEDVSSVSSIAAESSSLLFDALRFLLFAPSET